MLRVSLRSGYGPLGNVGAQTITRPTISWPCAKGRRPATVIAIVLLPVFFGSRFTAGAFGFFILSKSGQRPRAGRVLPLAHDAFEAKEATNMLQPQAHLS